MECQTGHFAIDDNEQWIKRSNGRWNRPKYKCKPLQTQTFGSWNVEGLGADYYKISELIWHMKQKQIAVLCIQETHVHGMHHYQHNNFTIILSGKPPTDGLRSFSGVGFIIAPWAISAVIGFSLINDRIASLKLRVNGGDLTLLSV